MSFPCPRCEGAKQTPVLAYCHCRAPDNCRCPPAEMEECSSCRGAGARLCGLCPAVATHALPWKHNALTLDYLCTACFGVDVGVEEADAWARSNLQVEAIREDRALPEYEPTP